MPFLERKLGLAFLVHTQRILNIRKLKLQAQPTPPLFALRKSKGFFSKIDASRVIS
jgi:hypothetical protein